MTALTSGVVQIGAAGTGTVISIDQDGSAGMSQAPIAPGATYTYAFTVPDTPGMTSPSPATPPPQHGRSANGWTACLWPWNWPRPGCGR